MISISVVLIKSKFRSKKINETFFYYDIEMWIYIEIWILTIIYMVNNIRNNLHYIIHYIYLDYYIDKLCHYCEIFITVVGFVCYVVRF